MSSFLHKLPDFRDLILVVADQKGIDPSLVEKDYWSLLIGGLGLGALLKSTLDFYQSRKAVVADRLYQEKRGAYLGLLGALHDAAVQPSDAHSKAYALWQTRCQLFGSPAVAQQAQAIVDTNDGPREARHSAFKALLDAMRHDLMR